MKTRDFPTTCNYSTADGKGGGLRERERERGFTGASLLASMCCCHTEYEEGGRHSSGGFLCLSLTFSVQDFLQDVATKTVPDPLHLAYPILL